MSTTFKTSLKRAALGLGAFGLAALIWVPCVHLFFRKPLADFYQPQGISSKARQLAARHLQLWNEPSLREAELKKMRSSAAEWDFMGRSFLVWSLVNMGLREPQAKEEYLPVIDRIIQETVRLEQEQGIYVFLRGFGYGKKWPASWQGPRDIDSGVVIPGFEVSAGSSGMAFMAASSFGDWEFLRALSTTLDMAAFPSRQQGQLKYCASNQVGDAALLYASVLGPLWERTCKP